MTSPLPKQSSAHHTLLQHRLKIRQLVLLTAIAEHKSVSKAASALHITQSAATKTLRELEDSMEVSLFNRTPRGVTPTAFGQSLIAHAKTILGAVNSAADDISALKTGSAGRIVIGILRAAAPGLLPDTFVRSLADYPNISITAVAGTYEVLAPALRAGDIDFFVGYLTDSRPRQDLIQERLYLDSAAIVTRQGHPLQSTAGALTLADIADRQWILPMENTVLRRHIDAAFRAGGAEPPSGSIESHSTTLVQSLLLKSDMLAALPLEVAVQLEKFGLLAILPVAVAGAELPVGITTYANRELKPAAKTLIEILRGVAREEHSARKNSTGQSQTRQKARKQGRAR
jgi:DNA-binding transcriptional LysR family regulator